MGYVGISWLAQLLRRRKRQARLAAAATWPTATGSLLAGAVVRRDPDAKGGTSFQDTQVEVSFYFTVDGSYYGGHLRSVPLSDSEAHRALKLLPEDTAILVRYNPADPDEAAVLAEDNAALPVAVWPG